jgi:D-glycero-alpha-D-manno-heptose-7-phosphate kinase
MNRHDEGRQHQLKELCAMVEEGISILNAKQDIVSFGKLLHNSWKAKSSLSSRVTNPYIEDIYSAAMSAGAIGGKLIGAGGGGFMLLFVRPSNQNKVRKKLNKFLYVPFKFAFSGSRIIFFDPEEDYSSEEKVRSGQTLRPFRELTRGRKIKKH